MRLGRIAPPSNLIAKATLIAPRTGFLTNRFQPFLQRHWRSAFFWVAIPTIGYLTIPESAYDRFYSYVSGPEPNYDGAVRYLAQVAVEEEGTQVVRVTTPIPVNYTVTATPEPTYDPRFAPFVNRKWNSEFYTFSIPRVGNVTCPVAIKGQVQQLLQATPPQFGEALTLIEEAAAADTIVEEGALNDASIETVQ